MHRLVRFYLALIATYRRWRARRILRKVSPLLKEYNATMVHFGVPRQERKRRLRSLLKGDDDLKDALVGWS